MELTLKSDKATLSAILDVKETETAFGTCKEISIIQSNGIAFDHAEIIAKGLLRLKDVRK
jgi:hypothetical protein